MIEFFLGCCCGVCGYFAVRWLRSLKWIDAKLTDNRMPHERYPEILSWKIGDTIRNRLVYTGVDSEVQYRGVTDHGTVIYARYGELDEAPLKRFMRRAVNLDLKNRELKTRLADSCRDAGEYQKVLEETRRMLEEAVL